MARTNDICRYIHIGEFKAFIFECPACGMLHQIPYEGNKGINWKYDGNREQPTFSPSIRVTWTDGNTGKQNNCHFFIRSGQIEFCGDCTHEMSGKKISLPPVEETTDTTWETRDFNS